MQNVSDNICIKKMLTKRTLEEIENELTQIGLKIR